MKVHVTDITATCGRIRKTNLGIQICSIEVDLTAILMDDTARLLDAVLKHAVGRWVRDLGDKVGLGTNIVSERKTYHERRKVVFVLLCLRTEVCNIETTIWQTLDRNHLQASHNCGLEVFQRQKVTA